MTMPLFLEDQTRYLVKYKNKEFECWRINNKFVTDNYHEIDQAKVSVLQRIGTPGEVFCER